MSGIEQLTEDLKRTPCEKDYKKEHCWSSIGVVGMRPYVVLTCSQCKRIIYVELKPLIRVGGSD